MVVSVKSIAGCVALNYKSDRLVSLFTNLYTRNSTHLSYLVSNSAGITTSVGPQESDGNGDTDLDLLT